MSGKKYVCNGATIECPLCTKPIGELKVTSNTIKLQDKSWANVKDKGKANIKFSGKCIKSPKQKLPCKSVIAPVKWINTGEILIQGDKALLECSTIKCSYGGATIKIKDHIQKSEPEAIESSDIAGITPDHQISQSLVSSKLVM